MPLLYTPCFLHTKSERTQRLLYHPVQQYALLHNMCCSHSMLTQINAAHQAQCFDIAIVHRSPTPSTSSVPQAPEQPTCSVDGQLQAVNHGTTDIIATVGQSRAAASDDLRHAQERHADSGARPQCEATESVFGSEHSTAACPGTEVGDLTADAGEHAGSEPTVNRSVSAGSLAQSQRHTEEQLLPDHGQPTAWLELHTTQKADIARRQAGPLQHMVTAAGCRDVDQQQPQAKSAARVSTEQTNLGLPMQPSRSQPQSPKPQVSTAARAGSEQANLGLPVPSSSQGQGQSAVVGPAAAPGQQKVADARPPQTTAEMLKWLDATLAAKTPGGKTPGAKMPAVPQVKPCLACRYSYNAVR